MSKAQWLITCLLCLWFPQGGSWRSKSSKRKGVWAQTAQARASRSSSWEAEAGIFKETAREPEICCIKFGADMISRRLGSLSFIVQVDFSGKHVEVCWSSTCEKYNCDVFTSSSIQSIFLFGFYLWTVKCFIIQTRWSVWQPPFLPHSSTSPTHPPTHQKKKDTCNFDPSLFSFCKPWMNCRIWFWCRNGESLCLFHWRNACSWSGATPIFTPVNEKLPCMNFNKIDNRPHAGDHLLYSQCAWSLPLLSLSSSPVSVSVSL